MCFRRQTNVGGKGSLNQVKNVGGFPRIVAGIFKLRWTRLTFKLKIRWGTVIYTRQCTNSTSSRPSARLVMWQGGHRGVLLWVLYPMARTFLRPGASDSCYGGVVTVLFLEEKSRAGANAWTVE